MERGDAWDGNEVGRPRAIVFGDGMSGEPTEWERIDLPVLRWAHEKPWGNNWQFDRGDDASDEVPGVSNNELDASLRRQTDAGFIAGNRTETIGYFYWAQLRITANGLRVLGQWPPDLGAGVDQALILLLGQLADQAASEEEAKWYRRAGGTVSRFGAAVVTGVVLGEVRRAGGEVVP